MSGKYNSLPKGTRAHFLKPEETHKSRGGDAEKHQTWTLTDLSLTASFEVLRFKDLFIYLLKLLNL